MRKIGTGEAKREASAITWMAAPPRSGQECCQSQPSAEGKSHSHVLGLATSTAHIRRQESPINLPRKTVSDGIVFLLPTPSPPLHEGSGHLFSREIVLWLTL
jgi:hypothetical protein